MLRKILPAIRPYVQVDAVARRRRSQTELERANARACRYGQEEGVSEGGRSGLDGKGGRRGRIGGGWGTSKMCTNDAVSSMKRRCLLRLPGQSRDTEAMRQ